MSGKGRTYTPEDKAASLAALAANGGNLAKTARQVGVPRKTLALWAQRVQEATPADATTPPKKGVAAEVAAMLPDASACLADKLEHVANVLTGHLTDPEKIADASLNQIAVAAAVAIDKMRLLREQPTSISGAALTDEERTRRLKDLQERVRRRLAAPVDA